MRTNCTKSGIAGILIVAISSCYLFTGCKSKDNFAESKTTLLEKAKLSMTKKDFSSAERFLVEAIKESPSKSDSTTFSILTALAEAQKQQGKIKESETTLLQALKLSQRVNGPESIETEAILVQLGAIYFSEHRFKESQESWQQALDIVKSLPEPDETKEMEAVSGVIASSCAQGMCSDNGILIKRLLELRRKNLGNEHPFTIISINLLGEFYDRTHNYAAAKPLYIEVYELDKRKNAPELPAALINLARIERREKDYKAAEELLNEALKLEAKDKTYGSMVHPNLPATLDSFVYLYMDQNNWQKASDYSAKALAIREQSMGKQHPQLPMYLKSHAEILHKVGRHKEAKKLEDRARDLEIER